MPIIPLPPELDAAQRQVSDHVRANREGRLPDLFAMLLHAPALARAWLDLGTAVRHESSLEDDVREMVITYTAHMARCAHEVEVHGRLAVRSGIPEASVKTLPNWRESDGLSGRVHTALALAEAIALGTTPSRDTVEDALDAFREQGVVEIVATVAYYNAVAIFLRGTDLDD